MSDCSFHNSLSGDKRNVISRSISYRGLASSLLVVLILSTATFAQTSGSLRGKVTDPTGAVIPGAVVTAKSSTGQTGSATSGGDGSYAINGLAPGQYAVSVTAEGFAQFSKGPITVVSGRPQALDIPLQVEVVKQNVDVQSEGNTLDTAPAKRRKGK